jgi:subtilisin family serine protease
MGTPTPQERGPAVGLRVLVAASLMAFSFQPTAQNQKNLAEFDRLAQKALSEGRVGVIVRLDVPGISGLTAASTTASTQQDASRAEAERRVSADTAIRSAIDDVSRNLLAELQGMDYAVSTRYGSIPFLALRVSAGALAALRASPAVLGIEEDMPVRLIEPADDARQTDVGEPDQPKLDTSVNLIGATTAWSWGYTGTGWYVAILDTGIRRTHQFFSGKSIVEACFALGADGVGGAGDCPNRNATQTGPGSAVHHPSTYFSYDHGTHVSGIATGNYGSLAGVAKNANIVAVQVFSRFAASACEDYSPCISTWDSDTLAGLDYIYSIRGNYRIASVNMSLGGSSRFASPCDSDSRKAAIDNLRSAGIATVIATGNDGSCIGISAPACISSSVAIGSSTDSDAASNFNNWHPVLQRLFAPGSAIYSSTATSNSSYASWSGTSMATPHVAGAWALMKQVIPNASVAAFLNALRATGVPIASPCDSRQTAIPRIRVDRAIASLIRYQLTIQSSQSGTTDPGPGVYTYAVGTPVQVGAIPDAYATFVGWSGSVTGSANPVIVTMDGDKSVFASFRFIFPPVASGRKALNRTFSQAEYINSLSWRAHSSNQGLNISRYRIYRVAGPATLSLIAEVAADQSAYEYQHRNAGQATIQYLIVAVADGNREGFPASVTIQ